MRTYATAQHIGTRSHQCDATAVRANRATGARAYVLLDGIGSSDTIQKWTRTAARQVAEASARRSSAEAGLRAVYERYTSAPERQGFLNASHLPSAAAVVAVATPGRPLTIAWCGDSRAYLLHNGATHRLTEDHNLRRVLPATDMNPRAGNRNIITSYLGAGESDQTVQNTYNHPAIETAFLALGGSLRILLASDGAYEPLEDSKRDLADHLTGAPHHAANSLVVAAINHSGDQADNATALVADISL